MYCISFTRTYRIASGRPNNILRAVTKDFCTLHAQLVVGGILGEINLGVIPTGILSLDSMLKGGFPTGSLVILLGDVGAGHTEFAYTSMLSLLNPQESEDIFGYFKNRKQLERVCYISLTKSWTDICNEILRSFPDEFYEALDEVQFKDFSEDYFSMSSVPTGWATESTPSFDFLKKGRSERDLINDIAAYLDEHAPNSLVVIDSITALSEYCMDPNHSTQWSDAISFFRGLQKISKRWDGVIYALLTANILPDRMQEQIIDCADGVLLFQWGEFGTSDRHRVMHVKKFRGLLPHLEMENFVRFETSVTADRGFSVSNFKQILW